VFRLAVGLSDKVVHLASFTAAIMHGITFISSLSRPTWPLIVKRGEPNWRSGFVKRQASNTIAGPSVLNGTDRRVIAAKMITLER
jgi:hypothetical protein